MKVLVLITTILFLLLTIIKINKESFLDFDSILLDSQSDSKITKKDIIDSSSQIINKGNIPVVAKGVDDKLITQFVKKQLNKEDVSGSGSYDTNADMLTYPITKTKDEVSPQKIDYDTLLSEQNNKIKTIVNRQDLTLRNLKYELTRLNHLSKSIPEILKEKKI